MQLVFKEIIWWNLIIANVYMSSLYFFLIAAFPEQAVKQRLESTVLCSLRSRRLEVVGERENVRARERHARSDWAPARKAPENRFNPH